MQPANQAPGVPRSRKHALRFEDVCVPPNSSRRLLVWYNICVRAALHDVTHEGSDAICTQFSTLKGPPAHVPGPHDPKKSMDVSDPAAYERRNDLGRSYNELLVLLYDV